MAAVPGDLRNAVLKQYVFDYVTDPNDPKTVLTETQSISDLPLNASNPDVRVNFLQHPEYDPKTGDETKRFSWVTDLAKVGWVKRAWMLTTGRISADLATPQHIASAVMGLRRPNIRPASPRREPLGLCRLAGLRFDIVTLPAM